MSITYNSKSISSDSVFYIDAANPKSAYFSSNIITTAAEDMSLWAHSSDYTTHSANVTTAPDGTMTADKVIEMSGTGTIHIFNQTGIMTTGVQYAVSFYAKAGERTVIGCGSNNNLGSCKVNLSTGAVISGSATVISAGNGWYKILTYVTPGGGQGIYLGICDASGNNVYNGDGTSGLYCWGVKSELGSVWSNYESRSGLRLIHQINDLSGKNYNVTAINTPVLSNNMIQFRSASTQWASAVFNESVLKAGNDGGSWTIESVYKQVSMSASGEAVVAGRSGCHGGIYINQDNTVQGAIKTNLCWTGAAIATAATMTNSQYYHIVMTYNNGLVTVYSNGVSVATAALDIATYDFTGYGDTFYISGVAGNYLPNIDLGMVRCYARALTATEVKQNFNSIRGRYGI